MAQLQILASSATRTSRRNNLGTVVSDWRDMCEVTFSDDAILKDSCINYGAKQTRQWKISILASLPEKLNELKSKLCRITPGYDAECNKIVAPDTKKAGFPLAWGLLIGGALLVSAFATGKSKSK